MAHRDNTEIGKYKILSQIGEGAMGVVYRATDPVLNRTVAIKVMSDALARDDDLRGRFLREAQAAGSLQHPNVITIFDCGEVDGHLFIAMEFVEGEDLEEVLRKQRPLSLSDKLDIVIDVLGGLAYAHKRGIVHRDIKPANIRIDEEGRARIMDFGIAHLQSSNLTRTGVMVGTPAYMAPEQIVGGAITPGTDIFSVGAVLFELLTGVRPFHADTLQSVMYKIVSQPAPDLITLAAEMPASLNAIVQRALAKDPNERYQNALDMANDLTAAQSSIDKAAKVSKSVSLRSVIDTALADERAEKARRAHRRGMVVGGSAAAAAAITVIVVMSLISKHSSAPPATVVTQNAATPTSAAPAPPSITPSPTTPSAPTAATAPTVQQPSQIQPPAAAQRAGTDAKSADVGATKQEQSLFESLRGAALENRRRAADAGATADQLVAGDDHAKAADAAAAKGKFSDAANHLSQATSAWTGAERDARVAKTAASPSRGATVDAPKPQSVPPAPQPAPTPPISANPATSPASTPLPTAPTPPSTQQASQASQQAATPTTSNPSADIRAAIAAYARAIESRDVSAVRRAYPGITAEQADGFAQFFGTVRSLRASLSADGIDVNGNAAEAKLAGEYDYVMNNGKSEKQPLNFQASFRRDGGVWKLVSVR